MVGVFPIEDRGLGNTSYVVDLGDGSALVIDPERDPMPYLEVAKRHRLEIRNVAETHLHADFVSGARELVSLGAVLFAPRGGQLSHPHRPVVEDDQWQVGDLTLRVIETPGHTPEHVAYLLVDGDTPLVLFSGGTLMAGGVARPDLVSPELTVPLAHDAYRSVRRLLTTLPGEVEVRPTHGGGSFCSSAGAGPGGGSTVATEKSTHPASTAPDAASFVTELLSGLGSYPPYFQRLREINRQGPHIYGVELPSLRAVQEISDLVVVDVRPIDRFARSHIPGSISISLRPEFGTWLGWIIEPDAPLVFVLDPDQEERDLVRQALNVGYENLAGRIDHDDWVRQGNPISSIPLLSASQIKPDSPLLDVRQASELSLGRDSGSTHVELGNLATAAHAIDPASVVHCGHGHRAMTAASLLARAGNSPSGVSTASYDEIARVRRAG